MKIKIQTRRVFGRVVHYPMCPLSNLLARLGKRKQDSYVLTDSTLKELMRLGFAIERVPEFGELK
jgi:hypothetical protein